jgi:high-affinity iron transporter
LIAGQGGSRQGLLGLAAGLLVGLAILAAVAVLIRSTSVKLPLRPFFKVTGFVLFAMAVVFAGNGVFELQNAGYIKITPLLWLGSGLPALGFHPNTQALSVQGLLLLGAVLAFVLPSLERKPKAAKLASTASAGA